MTIMISKRGTEPMQKCTTDLRAFRKCLGHYGTGVAVVAAQVEGQRCGMTINSFSALSLSPPLVMWSIRNESSARSFFTTAPHFSVNVLASDQVDVSGRFAQSGSDPFEPGGWSVGEHGEPLLDGAAANLCCSLVQIVPGGDHTIIIGQVVSYAHADRTPLLFVQGEYRVPSPHPHNHSSTTSSQRSAGVAGASLMRLLSTVASQWIDEFDIDRAAENLSRSQSRALAWLSEGPHTLDMLRIHIGLTDADLDEDVHGLIALGYVQRIDPLTFTLTPLGHAKRDVMAARIHQFEDAKLAHIDGEKIVMFRQFLVGLLKK
jgi:flavin reductase (DIM6/NTAB) family NADH-FMN oxidoreductase RutF/DNA-binding MarR family transcriptional regulator